MYLVEGDVGMLIVTVSIFYYQILYDYNYGMVYLKTPHVVTDCRILCKLHSSFIYFKQNIYKKTRTEY